jgi:tRNA ligase
LPPDQVSSFAEEFGFIPTKYVTLNTLDEVRSFTSEVSQSGSWEGEMIEGFVVRSTVRDTGSSHSDSKPPYPPGTPFFFKVKFDEPYLLYRTWREVTRAMLPLIKNPGGDEEEKIRKRVKNKTKRPEVAVYVGWVERMLRTEPELFDNFERGVVKVRERFLKWTEGEGKAEWEAALSRKPLAAPKQAGESASARSLRQEARAGLKKKFVLVPMAIPGCGELSFSNYRTTTETFR